MQQSSTLQVQTARWLIGTALALYVLAGPSAARAWWWDPGPEPTNTNECVADLGGLTACEATNALGLPSNLGGCCNAVRELAKDRCECNPAVDLLLGAEGQQIYDLEALCRVVQPLKWVTVVPRVLRSCSDLERHDYGCAPNDMEMDAARLQSVLTFHGYFEEHVNATMCLDTPGFVQDLGTVFEPDIEVFIPYGIGTYVGIENVAEYLGMAMSSLNHDFWYYDTTIDRTLPAMLSVSTDGSSWVQGSTFRGSFVRGALPYSNSYQEQQAYFQGCETKVQEFEVLPTPSLRDWVETYVQAADLSQRWGVEDICRYHTEFCADDPATRQYDSEAECLAYIGSLPLYTEACGVNRPLSGNSLSCKFKHHFMIPANPELHCAHIGPAGAMDPHGHLKCDDMHECSDPFEGSSWPLVSEIGPNTPSSVVDIFEASNVGYADEPYGCAVPTHANPMSMP